MYQDEQTTKTGEEEGVNPAYDHKKLFTFRHVTKQVGNRRPNKSCISRLHISCHVGRQWHRPHQTQLKLINCKKLGIIT